MEQNNELKLFEDKKIEQNGMKKKKKGISEAKDFVILTNILTQAWSGHSVKEYKNLKDFFLKYYR